MIEEKSGTAMMNGDIFESCSICPRECKARRKAGNVGFCGMTDEIRIARAALHMWEEPCISGTAGSGAVFFSGCNLRCVFCQNYDISRAKAGLEVSSGRLVEIFLELQEKGANNINLVTPTHYAHKLPAVIEQARRRGLVIPTVYNCGGYEKPETVEMLKDYIDVWMPDFKYLSSELSLKYSGAADYFERACVALKKMVENIGAPVYDSKGLMKRGVLVRHLVLPGQTADSKRILRYLHDNFGSDIVISIMNQFTPLDHLEDFPELNRKVSNEEYARVVDFADRIGIEQCYIQEGGTVSESFIPAFDGTGVFG